MNTQSVSGSEVRASIPIMTWVLGAVVLAILLVAARDWTPTQLLPTLVSAIMIVILDWFPIYLDPAGDLRLITVIAIPTIVLFGWPTAMLGAAIAMAVEFLYRPPRDVLVHSTERLASLIAAATLATALPANGPNGEVAVVVAAGLGYAIVRTLIVSARLHSEESIAWLRAVRFVASSTFFHLGVFTAAAAVTVWVASNDPSTTSRLLVPIVAAAVTLQLYFPRILRGQEQRQVLAAVSVLAAAVDAKDPYTADHSAEVASLSRRVARILNLDEPEVHRVYLAGLLHDVGKTVVPQDVLLKPGKLTDEEWQVMRSHVEAGVRIVESIGGLAGIAPLVAASHEHLDGRGYPTGLKGEAIPLGSRINLGVDAYNALTTNRPYRAARPPDSALQELDKNAGTQFDPQVVDALRVALRHPRASAAQPSGAAWWTVLRQPAFALLWTGQLISFLGDEIFFIALTLWIFQLTGSATILAATVVVATIGQGLLGFFAGALADRIDRRGLMIISDLGRAGLVAVLPLVILRSIPAGFLLLAILNIGTVFFRSAVYALIPSVVPMDELPTGNALLNTTERIAEIVGGPLGSALVLAVGYHAVFLLDAASFVISGVCVALMPIMWRVGLGAGQPKQIISEIGEGVRYIWQTPLHRGLALLILPGYLTLGFTALRAPMILRTAGLPIMAYGIINSAVGIGKLVSAIALTGTGKRLTSVSFVYLMFLVTAVSIVLFGSSSAYPALIASAFLFGLGNVATNIANATISMANTPTRILGRLMASRQVFVAIATLVGTLVFGRLADLAGPPEAIILLGTISATGIVAFWLFGGNKLARRAPSEVPGSVAE